MQTRSGKILSARSIGVKTKKRKRTKYANIYLVGQRPLAFSLSDRRNDKFPHTRFPEQDVPVGTKLYVSELTLCNNKWYNNGKVTRTKFYTIFLCREEAQSYLDNYRETGEDKWVKNPKIHELILQS